MQLGFDYASVDGNAPPSWPEVARTFSFGILRATYRTMADPTAKRDLGPLREAGIVAGEYMFPVLNVSAPSSSDQVKAFIGVADVHPFVDLPPMLDVEFPRGIGATGRSRSDLLAWIRNAIFLLRDHYGCWPLLYTSQRVWEGTDADCLAAPPTLDLVECPLVLARYPYAARLPPVLGREQLVSLAPPPVPASWDGAWWIHQYQGDALHAPGFSSTVDLDRFIAMINMRPSHARWVQRRLHLAETGTFDNITIDAIRELQGKHGLSPDGIVGVKTFAALCWLT